MKPYRALGPLAMLVSVGVLAQLALPQFFPELPYEVAMWPLLATVLLTVQLVYLAARNLAQLGDGQARFTPAQCVLYLILPIVNLFMVHQVLTALWRDSQPGGARRPRVDFSVLAVNSWWFLLAARFVMGWVLEDRYLGQYVFFTQAFYVAAGVAFIVVVLGIAARQREQWVDLERRRNVPLPTANALR